MSMMVEAAGLLAVDVGSVHTRAALFDVVDGRYRMVATGRAASTADRPLLDVGEGIRTAMEQIQAITGRRLLDESDSLIMPSTTEGEGVDVFVATASAGPTLRAVLLGLTPGVSLQSARRLANTSYLHVVEEICLADRRREEEQIDLILRRSPDLILVAGGTDGGARASVLRMIESIQQAVSLMPDGHSPRVLFTGNRHLGASVAESLGDQAQLTLTPNIRPSLELEDLDAAHLRLAEVVAEARSMRIGGLEELRQWAGGYLMLSADGFGRVMRYLSEVYGEEKGVLGIDLGASHTTVAAAFGGELHLTVRSDLGLGEPAPHLLSHCDLDDIAGWLPVEMPPAAVSDYLHNKSLYPASVPADKDELHLEFAVAREAIRSAVRLARPGWPAPWGGPPLGRLPPMEPIVATGGALSRAPRAGYAALVLLDALQPTGITTLVLDPYNLTPMLGAAAGPLPLVTVQVMESGSLANLGTVVAPVGRGRPGKPVLRVSLHREAGGEKIDAEIRFGQLVVLPLSQGEYARLTLRPERGFDVGFGGPGRAGALRVAGGAVGLIIDARGRPLELSRDGGRRRELMQQWLWDIGAI